MMFVGEQNGPDNHLAVNGVETWTNSTAKARDQRLSCRGEKSRGSIGKTLPPEFQSMTVSAPVTDHKIVSTVRNASAK